MFTFDGNYKNLEQVEPFYAEFKKIKDSIEAQGKFAYNDDFIGKIPALAGEHEGKGIYLLQSLDTENDRQAKIKELQNNGYKQVTPEDGGCIKFESVVKVGTNYSRDQAVEYPKARIFFAEKRMFIVPKGNRTRGYNVWPDQIVLAK